MGSAVRMVLLVVLALCGAVCSAKSVWVFDAQRLYQVNAITHAVTRTVDEPGVVGLAADSQGGVWALAAGRLVHVSVPARASDLEIPLVQLDLARAGSMRLDPYDDAVWVTDGDKLVRVSLDGQVTPPLLVPEHMADWAVGMDQTLWLLGSNSLRQYGRLGLDRDRLLASHSLDGLKSLPGRLAIDSLHNRVWLSGDKTLSLIDLTGHLARADLDLPEPVQSISVDHRTGAVWVLSKAGLAVFAPTPSGKIASLPWPRGDSEVERSSVFALEQTGKVIWLVHAAGLCRIDVDSHESSLVPVPGAEPLLGLSSPAFSVTPTLLLVSPRPPNTPAAGTELVFGLGARCPDGPCVAEPSYFAGIEVEGVFGAHRFSGASVDPAARQAKVLVPMRPNREGPLTLAARAVDSLGHASAPVNEHFRSAPVSAPAVVSGGSAPAMPVHPAAGRLTIVGPGPAARVAAGEAAFAELASNVRRRPGSRPIALEINRGQHHPDVRFYAKAPVGDAYLTKGKLILGLRGKPSAPSADQPAAQHERQSPAAAVQVSFVGASQEPQIDGLDLLESYSSYFVGSDPRQWRTRVPHYARAWFRDIYPGVDAIYSGESGSLEYDFIVAPGADPGVIRQEVSGAEAIALTSDGRLAVQTAAGEVFLSRPVLYQTNPSGRGRRIVDGGFVVQGGRQFGFWVGAYDRTRPLVIDPVVIFTGPVLASQKIAVDASSNIYVAGINLFNPVTNGPLTNFGSQQTLLVQKLSADGSTVLWNAFFGGNGIGYDTLTGLAVDAAGSAYITGRTPNADFPTTAGAFQSSKRSANSYGHEAAFVSKLSPTGDSLVYSTFLSGSTNESANGIALDASGNAYITGHTNSSDFPRTAGTYRPSGGSGFLAKLNSTGSALVYSDVMGALEVSSPVVDSTGIVYVAGAGQLGAIPVTGTGYQGALGYASSPAYLLRLNTAGTQISAVARLGGAGYCGLFPQWMGRDSTGSVFLGGTVSSCTAGTLDVDPAVMPFPPVDGRLPFVAKFSSDLSTLANFFLVGASAENLPTAFAVDADGGVYVCGSNYYPNDFPYFNVIPGTPGTFVPSQFVQVAPYLAKINPEGRGLVFVSSLSADNPFFISDLAVDASKNVFALTFGSVFKLAAPETLAITLSSSKTSVLLGKPLTLSARVSGGAQPTGSVDFLSGSTLIGSAPLVSGVATLTISTLNATTHSLTARYSGDAGNAVAVSQAMRQVVFAPAVSTTSLSVDATTVPSGAAVVFRASTFEDLQSGAVLDPALPRTLVLREGGTVLATIHNPPYGGLLNTVRLNNLLVGTHTVVAYFSGTEEILPSQSDPVSVTVLSLTPPVASIEVSPSQTRFAPPANYNVTVTASGTGGATIQSVYLTEAFGPTTLFSGPLAGPAYVYPVTGKLEGAYQYTAVVTDSNGLTTTVSTSALVHQAPTVTIISPLAGEVLQAPLNLTLTARASFFDPYPYARGPGNSYQITRLEFREGLVTRTATVPVGSLGLNPTITATVNDIPPGTHTVRAYVADGYGGEALSDPVTFTVNPVATPPWLTAAWVGVSSGQTVPSSFNLQVAAIATGASGSTGATQFQLYEGDTLLQEQTVYLGARWTFAVRAAPGVHHYRAVLSDRNVSATTQTLTLNVVAGQAGPTIAMGGQLDGASVAAGSSITLPIDARPGSNGLQRIDIYNGATLLGSSTSPGDLVLQNVAAGDYSITAVATDNAGFQTQTAPVRISVGAPLTIALSAPADRASFTAPASFALTANVAPAAGNSIARVEFYQGAMLIGTATTPPYSVAFSSQADGAYIFTARGYTATGASAISAPIQVLVQTPATPGVPSDSVVYLHTDVAGSPIAATDQSGAVVWRESYKPFGERDVRPAADVGTRQYFHGKPADAESGLSYFGARHFDPVAGRFMGADPVGFHEGNVHSFNRYAYGNNNPYLYRDPDGRLPILIPIALYVFGNAAIGAGIDYSIQRAMGHGDVNWNQVALSGAIGGILGGEAGAVTGTALTAARVSAPVVAKEAGIIANGARGLTAETRVLKELGLKKNTKTVSTAEGRSVPDALTDTLSVEIKDAARVARTSQVRIQTEAARNSGRESVLITGEKTCVSGPCARSFDRIIRRSDLGPQ